MKTRRLISLEREVDDDISRKIKDSNKDFNFSEWVETEWMKYNMTEKGLNIQLKNAQKRVKMLKNSVNYRVKMTESEHQNKEKIFKLSLKKDKKKKEAYDNAVKIMKKNPKLINAQMRYWAEEFNLKVSKVVFMRLMGLI